jgi:hypothetical protein
MLSTFYPDGKPYVIVWSLDDPALLHHEAV